MKHGDQNKWWQSVTNVTKCRPPSIVMTKGTRSHLDATERSSPIEVTELGSGIEYEVACPSANLARGLNQPFQVPDSSGNQSTR